MSRKKKLVNNTNIPEHVIETVARCLMPDILTAFEDEAVQAEFAAWQAEQAKDAQKLERKAA